MAFFKGDETEQKFNAAGMQALSPVSLEKDEFFEEAFTCVPLANLLYTTKRAPLTRSIPYVNFKDAFSEIFSNFPRTGTFEVYLTVFRAIFGDDVEVTFTVPGPGELEIDIVATGLELSNFIAREIEDNEYVHHNIVDHEADQIVFQGVKGFQTQYELERMLFEMVVAGVFVTVTLQIGEEE